MQVPNYKELPYLVGIATLRAFLSDQGLQVKCIDPFHDVAYSLRALSVSKKVFSELNENNLDSLERLNSVEMNSVYMNLKKILSETRPRFFGFSVMYGTQLGSLYLARLIKRDFPEIQIVFGGPASNNFTESDLKCFECVDFIVVGEGEWTTLALLKSPLDLEALKKIQGLRINLKNFASRFEWIKTTPRPAETDLSQFVFSDYSDYANNRYFKRAYRSNYPISFSRGCPYRCSFCSVNAYAIKFRHFPVEKCLVKIEKIIDQGYRHFKIDDSIVNGNPAWLIEFCEKLIARNLKIKWSGSFRLQTKMKDPDYVNLIFRSGCESMVIGLESASHRVLKDMKKYHNVDEIRQMFDNIRKAPSKGSRRRVYLQLIVGYLNEREEDFQETLDFVGEYRDIIAEINSCSAFLLGETEAAMSSYKGEGLFHRTEVDWATPYSNPEIRIDRMLRAQTHFKKLGLQYRMYYLDKLQALQERKIQMGSTYHPEVVRIF